MFLSDFWLIRLFLRDLRCLATEKGGVPTLRLKWTIPDPDHKTHWLRPDFYHTVSVPMVLTGIFRS
jgi:hypothetical protein